MTGRIAAFLAQAKAEAVELTIRDLLTVWDYRTRTFESVGRIQRDLDESGLQCRPNLEDGGLGTTVWIGTVVIADSAPDEASAETTAPPSESGEDSDDTPLRLPHILPLIGDIPSATAGVVSITPSKALQYAQDCMVMDDFSQLPVISGDDLIGVISWRSVAKARLKNPELTLSDAIDHEPTVVRTTDKLFEQIQAIYDNDFVLVRRAEDDTICGIVTTADLTARFRDLTSPFFQLGEIELRLRRCTRPPKFSVTELQRAANSKKIKSADDMTFGNYVYLLKDEDMWHRLGWYVSQEAFIEKLCIARNIRNSVAHYDARPITDSQRLQVKNFLDFMRYIDPHPLS